MVDGELVDQLGGVKGAGSKPEVAFQRQEGIYGLTAGYCVQVFPSGKRNQAVGKQFQVPGEFAPGLAQALGKALYFAQARRIEGEDAVRLAQLGFFDDDGFSLISSWIGHFKNLYLLKLNSFGALDPRFSKMSLSFKRQALLCAMALLNCPLSHAIIHNLPLSSNGSS